jgi:type I restriction enzyme M protein
MKPGSRCGIVLDEGVLFRVDAEAFVQTKRKLLEECDVYCIISLPGGVFSSAGAGVKTNLVFFDKGNQTERIWYYDLSDIKVGKKTPLTLEHFDEFSQLLANRGESERSWTIDFATRLQTALAEAQPFREKAAELRVLVTKLEDDLATLRKEKQFRTEKQRAEIELAESRLKEMVREAREAENKAVAIENAVYDLKAINPNRVVQEDTRTSLEILQAIEEKGREADSALARLQTLLTS